MEKHLKSFVVAFLSVPDLGDGDAAAQLDGLNTLRLSGAKWWNLNCQRQDEYSYYSWFKQIHVYNCDPARGHWPLAHEDKGAEATKGSYGL